MIPVVEQKVKRKSSVYTGEILERHFENMNSWWKEMTMRMVIHSTLLLVLMIGGCIQLTEKPPKADEESQAFATAHELYRDGDYQHAVELLRQFIQEEPRSPRSDDAAYLLTVCYYRLGEDSLAIAFGEEFLRRHRDSPYQDQVHHLLASSFVRHGDVGAAADQYAIVLEGSDDPKLRERAERALRSMVTEGLTVEELERLERKLGHSEIGPSILLALGEQEMASGRGSEAAKWLKRLMDRYPDTVEAARAEELIEVFSSDGSVRVAVLVPLTGEYGVFGRAVLRGVRLAFEEKRTEGEPLPLDIVEIDSEGDPVIAVKRFQDMVPDQRIMAVIGPVVSVSAIATGGVANAYGLPLVSPTATDPRIADIGPFVFQLTSGGEFEGKAAGRYACERLGLKRHAVLYPNDGYGKVLCQTYVETVQKSGGIIVAKEPYLPGATDFEPQIVRIAGAEPECLFIPGHASEVVLIGPQLRYHMLQAQVVGTQGWGAEQVRRLGGQYVDGVVYVELADAEQVSNYEAHFVQAYRKRYGEDPIRSAYLGYDAMVLVYQALSQGAKTREHVREALNALPASIGVSGPLNISPRYGSQTVEIMQIMQGQPVRLETMEVVSGDYPSGMPDALFP